MKVRFWGVRGSIPVPGPETSKYGGNSSCVEIEHDGHVLILDCGTGARALGRDLFGRKVREVDLLFTHFHMDHVFGFPFFAPVYAPGFQVRVHVPAFSQDEARERLARYCNAVYHPVRLRELPATVSFHPVQPGRAFECGPFKVTGLRLNHPGGSLGYRVEAGGRCAVYVTDTAPLARPGEGAAGGEEPSTTERRLSEGLRGADCVVFDTMFSFDEYLEKMTWGHSYPEYALALCELARVQELVLFHHSPDASDDELDALGASWEAQTEPRVTLAREGRVVDLEG